MSGLKKSTHSIIGALLGVLACLMLYVSMKNRWLPFLKSDVVVTGGKEIPTQVFIDSTLPMFLYAIPVFILVGVINYMILKNRESK